MRDSPSKRGLTLVEILIALSLLGLLTVMLFTSFHAVSRSWEVGRAAIDASGHSDYLMEQLSMALRSAYYPGSGDTYGLILTDDGDDEDSHDAIEWTKVGPALIGEDADFSDVPHRVRVTVSDADDTIPGGFTVRAWRQDLQLDDFDPETDAAEIYLSPKVIGFNCRALDPDQTTTTDGEPNWIDDWTKTNYLPTAVELTLWLEPAEKGGEPIESKRIVEIPMGVLSQNPSLASSTNSESTQGTSTSVSGSGRRSSSSSGTGTGQQNGQQGQVFQPGDGSTPPTPPDGGGGTPPDGGMGAPPDGGGGGMGAPPDGGGGGMGGPPPSGSGGGGMGGPPGEGGVFQ